MGFDIALVQSQQGEVFGKVSSFDCLDHSGFEAIGEELELLVIVKLSSVEKTSGPCEDGGDRV